MTLGKTKANVNDFGSLFLKTRKAHICGIKAADVLDNFFGRQTLVQVVEYFGAFATNVTSQRPLIQNVAPSATVWP